MSKSSKKVIVTGATGFIGRHVLEELQLRGYELHCLTHSPKDISGAHTYSTDLLSQESGARQHLHEVLSRIQADYLMHLAWYTDHTDYLVSPINLQWMNATLHLTDAFFRTGGKRMLATGTCAEYELSQGKPLLEDQSELHPATYYGQCKRDTFWHLEKYRQQHQVEICWARIFFVYGPGEQKERLIPYILDSLKHNRMATPKNGQALRDYIYVKDLAVQLADLLESSALGAINTGTGKAQRIQQIFHTLGSILSKTEWVGQSVPATTQDCIEADMNKFYSYIPRKAFTSWEKGIQEMLSSR